MVFNIIFSNANSVKLPIASTAKQQQQRIAKICGKSFINNSLYFEQNYNDIELAGWLGNAEAHRPQTDVQYFFINGRVIRDRVINHAIRQAYIDLIPAGRHPAFVLYLTLPLDQVDINVHPTKHEVRFRDARLVHGLITRALHDALAAQPTDQPATSTTKQQTLPDSEHIAEQSPLYQSVKTTTKQPNAAINFTAINNLLFHRYLVVDSEQGMFLLDLQLAEQNLRQQQLIAAINTNSLSSRPILVPIHFALTAQQHQQFTQQQAILALLGIHFRLDDDHIIIETIPSLLAQVNLEQLIHALITAFNKQQCDLELLSTVLQQQCPLVAIHSLEQAESILRQLPSPDKATNWCCPLDQQTLSGLF